MTRGRNDAHTVGDLPVTIDDRVLGGVEVNPLGHGVVRLTGRGVLGCLDVDRHTRKASVVTAMIEVEMRVDDQSHVAEGVSMRGERSLDGAMPHVVEVIDELVAGAD